MVLAEPTTETMHDWRTYTGIFCVNGAISNCDLVKHIKFDGAPQRWRIYGECYRCGKLYQAFEERPNHFSVQLLTGRRFVESGPVGDFDGIVEKAKATTILPVGARIVFSNVKWEKLYCPWPSTSACCGAGEFTTDDYTIEEEPMANLTYYETTIPIVTVKPDRFGDILDPKGMVIGQDIKVKCEQDPIAMLAGYPVVINDRLDTNNDPPTEIVLGDWSWAWGMQLEPDPENSDIMIGTVIKQEEPSPTNVYQYAAPNTPAPSAYVHQSTTAMAVEEFTYTDLRNTLRPEYIKDESWDESVTMDKNGKSVPKYSMKLRLKSGTVVEVEGTSCKQLYQKLPKFLKREIETKE